MFEKCTVIYGWLRIIAITLAFSLIVFFCFKKASASTYDLGALDPYIHELMEDQKWNDSHEWNRTIDKIINSERYSDRDSDSDRGGSNDLNKD